VAEDQALADVMTDKATVEIPSHLAGRVVALGGEVGQSLAVGAELIRIEREGAAGEVAAPAASVPAPPPKPVAAAVVRAPGPPPPAPVRAPVPAKAPAASAPAGTNGHVIASPALRE